MLHSTTPLAALLTLLATGLLAPTLRATDGTWSNASGGPWGTDTNWSGNNIATGQDATANLSAAGSHTITLDTTYTIGNLNFGSSSTTVSSSTLTLSTSTGTPTITATGTGTTITSSLAGTQGFIKAGTGNLYIGGSSNTISGVLEVSAGTLGFKNNATVANATFKVDSGASLGIGQAYTTYSNAITLNGGSLTVQNNAIYNGNVTLTADSTINRVNNGTFGNSTSVITGSGYNLTLTASNSGCQIASAIQTGTGGVTVQAGATTLTLTGANTYSGGTTISTGTLALTGAGSIANSTAYSIAAGAKFDVSGLTTKGYSLANVATTLDIGAATNGFINVGNTGALTLGGGSSLALNFTALPTAGSFNLYDSASVSGDFQDVSISGTLGSGSLGLSGGIWSGVIGGYNLSLDESSGLLTVAAAIPEPATTGLALGGAAVLGILLLRRRRTRA